jgi:hypothetical protein
VASTTPRRGLDRLTRSRCQTHLYPRGSTGISRATSRSRALQTTCKSGPSEPSVRSSTGQKMMVSPVRVRSGSAGSIGSTSARVRGAGTSPPGGAWCGSLDRMRRSPATPVAEEAASAQSGKSVRRRRVRALRRPCSCAGRYARALRCSLGYSVYERRPQRRPERIGQSSDQAGYMAEFRDVLLI